MVVMMIAVVMIVMMSMVTMMVVHALSTVCATCPRPASTVVYAGDAAYSDSAFTRNGSVAVFFEKGWGGFPYRSVAFAVVPPPVSPPAKP